MADFLSILDRFGVSVGVLIAVGVAIWRTMVFLAPRFSKLIDAHCAFVEGVSQTAEKTAEQSEKQTQLMQVQCGLLERQGLLIGEIHNAVHRENG